MMLRLQDEGEQQAHTGMSSGLKHHRAITGPCLSQTCLGAVVLSEVLWPSLILPAASISPLAVVPTSRCLRQHAGACLCHAA